MNNREAKPRFFVLLSVIAALVFAVGVMAVRGRMARDAEVLQQLRREQQTLVDSISELEDELEYAQTDEYVENAAREELNMIMPGEIRYMGQDE
jgi:cell division protein FtsB